MKAGRVAGPTTACQGKPGAAKACPRKTGKARVTLSRSRVPSSGNRPGRTRRPAARLAPFTTRDRVMRYSRHSRARILTFRLILTAGLSAGCSGWGEDDRLVHTAISPDGKYFARSTPSGTTIYEVEGGRKLKVLKDAGATRLKFSRDSRYLATASGGELSLRDWSEGKALAVWHGKNRFSFDMDFSPDGTLLAARDDNSLRVWDTGNQRAVLSIPLDFEMGPVAFSPDGKLLAVAGTRETATEPRFHEINLWEVARGKLLESLHGEYCIVNSLAFSADGSHLAAGLSIQSATLWSVATKKEVWKQKVGNVDYEILAFSSDGKRLAIGGYETLCVLGVSDGKLLKRYELPGSSISSLAAAKEPNHLLLARKRGLHSLDLNSGLEQVLISN